MLNIKVSVIIPTIGRKSLRDTIESVINQSYKNLEIIITDDTEDRKAFPIVKPYLEQDERIKYVVNTKYKHGPAGNKNNGLDHITGDYFTIVDDDDTLMPDAIEKLINIAQKHGYSIVFANCKDQYGRYTGKHFGKSQEVDYVSMLCSQFEGDYFVIAKSSLLEGERFIDECWGAEGILWFKLWKKAGKGFYLHEALKNIYESYDSVTKTATQPDKVHRQMLNYVYYIELFQDDFMGVCPKQIIRFSLSGMIFANLSRDRKRILWFLLRCFEASRIYTFLLALPWAIFCLIIPRKIVSIFWKWRSVKGLLKWVLLGKRK